MISHFHLFLLICGVREMLANNFESPFSDSDNPSFLSDTQTNLMIFPSSKYEKETNSRVKRGYAESSNSNNLNDVDVEDNTLTKTRTITLLKKIRGLEGKYKTLTNAISKQDSTVADKITALEDKQTKNEQRLETRLLQSEINGNTSLNALSNQVSKIATQLESFETALIGVEDKLKGMQQDMDRYTIQHSPMELKLPVVHQSVNEKKGKLLSYLESISGLQTISGQMHYKRLDEQSREVHSTTGVYPGLWNAILDMNTDIASQYMETAISQWNSGSLVSFTFIQCSPVLEMKSSCSWYRRLSSAQWNDLVTDGSNLNKKWKLQMDSIVPSLKQLERAGIVAIVDFLYEINDSSRWWCGVTGNKGSRKLFQMTHDYLTRFHNLTSLIWTWSVLPGLTTEKYQDYWPGNHFVDVVSLHLEEQKEPTANEYQNMLQIAGNKPISIGFIKFFPKPKLFVEQPKWVWFIKLNQDMKNYSNGHPNETLHDPRILNRNNIRFFTG